MARILGLDLGSYSVKGVLFESNIRGYTTKAYTEVRRAEGDRTETLRAAVKELLAQQPMQADQVIVALPGPTLLTHAFTLPFSDPKRLEAALPFEVESQLPFDLSEVLFDYQVVGQKAKANSDVLVGVVRKEELSWLLGLLTELKVDPRVITHPGITYQNLFIQTPAMFDGLGEAEAIAVVDIGHERTTVAIGKPGVGVEFARTFAGGGRDLSRALAAEFQTPLAEAHQWKETYGAMASAATAQGPDAERAASAFVRGLQPVLRELRPTFKAFTARTKRNVGAVVLCGGTARLKGLAEQLEKDLHLQVRVLALPNEAASSIPAEVQPSAVQAYSLALRGQASGAKAPRFNLRRGEFGFKGDFDYVKDKIGLLGSFAATLLLLFIASGVVRNTVLARNEAKVDAVLCKTTERILGKCETNYDRALNLLRGVESPAAALPKVTAVNLLAEVTQRIPPEVPVKIERIQIDLERVILQGETNSSKEIDTLTTALKTHRCFREVNPGKVEKTRDGQKVTFRLDIQVQCPNQPGAES
ncbi:pilus assembly protein PilM [Hyalangium minutum]|uniref:Putative general secretion pathway protein L n=1 Tax=Hyalangium minutum TaxID=394096 RepID=A0A085W6H7_9BACT|nr:pilus assembly protein PilM [Hyalangium minutum]KFE63290.1 putative general secretion pathway protein L [Hyalangium minutum]